MGDLNRLGIRQDRASGMTWEDLKRRYAIGGDLLALIIEDVVVYGVCLECGKEYETDNLKRRYCTDYCRRVARSRRRTNHSGIPA